MKNLSIIFCVFFYCFSFSQVKTEIQGDLWAVYKLEYKKRLLSDIVAVEPMILIVKKNGTSKFLNQKMILIDSIQKNRALNEFDTKSGYPVNDYFIERNNNSFTHTETVGNDIFTFEQNLKPNWILASESKTISGFNCKKALLNFAGRNWVAWYAMSIPSSSGPYKFYGLPGLILEVYDTEEIFHFTVDSLDTGFYNTNPDVLNYFIREKNDVLKPIDSNDFFKIRKKFYQLSLNEQLQYMNPNESGVTMQVTTLQGEVVPMKRKPKERNFIERFD